MSESKEVIPDEAIEAAARNIYESTTDESWDAAGVDDVAETMQLTLNALESAAPYIRAQALKEAAAELDDKRLLSKAFHIFYPEWLRERAARLVSK